MLGHMSVLLPYVKAVVGYVPREKMLKSCFKIKICEQILDLVD